MIEIKNRFTGALIYKSETAATTAEAVAEAVNARANLAGANLADADLAGANLPRADLEGAYLAGANLARANLPRANLAGAYLAGANLAGAYLTGAYLTGAYLARADLAGANLPRADLEGANLALANLTGANLALANLAGANLAGAYLTGAYLADADLEDARSLPVGTEAKDPSEPYIRGAVTSAEGRVGRAKIYRQRHPEVPVVENLDRKILEAVTTGGGSLEMGAWHTCETTHCRAGWAIHLAGKAGYELEKKLGDSQLAGRAIYLASTGRAPHFFATNSRALEDIKRSAELAEGVVPA